MAEGSGPGPEILGGGNEIIPKKVVNFLGLELPIGRRSYDFDTHALPIIDNVLLHIEGEGDDDNNKFETYLKEHDSRESDVIRESVIQAITIINSSYRRNYKSLDNPEFFMLFKRVRNVMRHVRDKIDLGEW